MDPLVPPGRLDPFTAGVLLGRRGQLSRPDDLGIFVAPPLATPSLRGCPENCAGGQWNRSGKTWSSNELDEHLAFQSKYLKKNLPCSTPLWLVKWNCMQYDFRWIMTWQIENIRPNGRTGCSYPVKMTTGSTKMGLDTFAQIYIGGLKISFDSCMPRRTCFAPEISCISFWNKWYFKMDGCAPH